MGLAALALAAIFLTWRYLRHRPSADELEKRRRAAIQAAGKLRDGEIVDVEGVAIVYSYTVSGVEYTASQDVSGLAQWVPEDLSSLVAVGVKYLPQNPANSIVLAEEWSGLRQAYLGRNAELRGRRLE